MSDAKHTGTRVKTEVLRAGRRLYLPAGTWVSLPIGVRVATLEIEVPDGTRVKYAPANRLDSSEKKD
jgi:hypothetical protein